MRRVDLPGGQWADLRDPEEITTRGRRGIQSIAAGITHALAKLPDDATKVDMSTLDLTEAEMDAFLRIGEATVVAFVAAWSLDRPLPTLDTVGDLPAVLFDALSEATSKDGAKVAKPAVQSLTLDMSPGEGAPDPKDPSGASAPSDGPSKDAPEQSPPILT